MPEGNATFDDDALPEDMEHDSDEFKQSYDGPADEDEE